MGIRETLGMGTAASWTYVGEYLRDHYIKNDNEKVRRDEAKKRDAYHEGGGDEHIKRFIYLAFEDPLVRKLRSDLVGQAKWDNVLRRVSQELATVYSQPATRRVAKDDEKYQEFLRLARQDAVMREVDKKLVYHEDVWIQYRVRKNSKQPVLDVVTPSMFWAVASPTDQTDLLAIILDQTPPRVTRITPCYRVWTADETFMLDSECRVIVSTVEVNSIGRIPGVLASTTPASAKGQLLSEQPAADIVAAHESVWFQNVLLIKESKSASKATYASGDVSNASLGQSNDTEREVILPEGVTVQAVDRGMDLTQFRDNADHMRERTAANRGIPPALLNQREATSGAEAHMRMLPLLKLRAERILVLRDVERDIAAVQSTVNKNDLPEYAFDVEGWGVDFSEVTQPLTESEKDSVFRERRELGLTDTVEEIRRRNPDLQTDQEAVAVLARHIGVETERVQSMRELQAMSGSMGASTSQIQNGGKSPFEANRGESKQEDKEVA